jgi:VanZ family protein
MDTPSTPAPSTLAAAGTLEKAPRPGKRVRPWAAAACLALLAFVFWGSLTPNPPQPGPALGDKVQHLAAYLSLTALAFLALRGRSWAAMAGLLAAGGLIEALQATMELGRTASWLDMLANASGVALVWLLWPRSARRVA